MHKLGRYTAADGMSSIIGDDYRVLLVMSRFGIPLGVGERSIGEVCESHGVDTGTFLSIANMLIDEDTEEKPVVSVRSLLSYLHNSHDYFLGFRLPAIRAKLVDVVGAEDKLSTAITAYFDEYIAEVEKHMMYEERTVFPYVRALIGGEIPGEYAISIFSRRHDQVEMRLSEFKNIIIKYYPARSTNELNGVMFDIFNCESDLASHNAVEDRLFIPAIESLERENRQKSEGKTPRRK